MPGKIWHTHLPSVASLDLVSIVPARVDISLVSWMVLLSTRSCKKELFELPVTNCVDAGSHACYCRPVLVVVQAFDDPSMGPKIRGDRDPSAQTVATKVPQA